MLINLGYHVQDDRKPSWWLAADFKQAGLPCPEQFLVPPSAETSHHSAMDPQDRSCLMRHFTTRKWCSDASDEKPAATPNSPPRKWRQTRDHLLLTFRVVGPRGGAAPGRGVRWPWRGQDSADQTFHSLRFAFPSFTVKRLPWVLSARTGFGFSNREHVQLVSVREHVVRTCLSG